MLELMIEETRERMIELAMELGLTAKETVNCSQQLDVLINLKLASSYQFDQTNNYMMQEAHMFI
ncbi:aspartyl-phosphate phosphatase Spo0E family protein [Bacillus sp. BGMRC 2118]|nr:aspartyl-phosphate phosphatase Spo0E family protein [Bacillus sp. BGMRC 2118]